MSPIVQYKGEYLCPRNLGDTYAYIKFKTTGARNGQIIPEWSLSGEYVKPKKGAELHKVVNGKDTVVAIFDGKHFVEVKGK